MPEAEHPLSPEAISFLEKFFDKIIVITIPRATERQQKVRNRLKGLQFEFFYGVDKHALNPDQILKENIYNDSKAKKLDRYGRSMVLGQVACALSHRKVYEHVLEQGYKNVLIFEDDLVTLEWTINEFVAAFEELPADWEMVYLGYSKYETVTTSLKLKQLFYKGLSYTPFLKWSPIMVDNLLPKPYSLHLRKAGFHDLLHAYAVTAEACKKLIEAQTPVVFVADPLVSHLIMNGQLKAFTTIPQFFTQEQFTDPAYRSLIHH
jgi:glycosyl transferase family 25